MKKFPVLLLISILLSIILSGCDVVSQKSYKVTIITSPSSGALRENIKNAAFNGQALPSQGTRIIEILKSEEGKKILTWTTFGGSLLDDTFFECNYVEIIKIDQDTEISIVGSVVTKK